MAKRFTDSDKWKKPWFRKLKPIHKAFWIYLLDNCDQAGFWAVDFDLAEFFMGEPLDREEIKTVFIKQYEALADGRKWFIRDFIPFQYGELKESNRLHVFVSKILEEQGVLTPLKQVPEGAKDKDKVKDEDKEKAFAEIWKKYPNKTGKTKAYEKFLRSVKTEGDLEAIREALSRYLKHLQVNTWKQAQDGKTWFNSWRDWVEFIEPERSAIGGEKSSLEKLRELRAQRVPGNS